MNQENIARCAIPAGVVSRHCVSVVLGLMGLRQRRVPLCM